MVLGVVAFVWFLGVLFVTVVYMLIVLVSCIRFCISFGGLLISYFCSRFV